jgi:alpha-galactosidase
MRCPNGTPRVCDRVWIASLGSADEERTGKLTTGFGAAARGPKIGPEFTFGIYMEKLLDGPILIVKIAWGGKSLNTDFRPPSGGPYEFNAQQLESFRKAGREVEAIRAEKAAATGAYYRQMIEYVKKVLADPGRVCPAYDPKEGCELAGFVWFQGWNDMVDSGTYPDRGKPGGYDLYTTLLADLIRDVRKDLSAPRLPFVIGVMGVGGVLDLQHPDRYTPIHDSFRKAMAAPAAMPEFKGSVAAVLTEKYWDAQLAELRSRGDRIKARTRELDGDKTLTRAQREAALEQFRAELYTPRELELLKGGSNFEFHYMGSAKILAQIGRSFAEAMAALCRANAAAGSE